MAINDNIGKNLDNQFENHNYLPQKLSIEDFDFAIMNFIKSFNFSVEDESGNVRQVPVIYINQELWAERKMNWKNMRSENGQEITRPFITILRTGTKKGTAPMKFTIPNKKKFTFLKVPKFDGTLKGYNIFKIPQPAYVDFIYEMSFITHYKEDANLFHEKILRDAYSNGQGYLNVNGYNIASVIEDPTEKNMVDEIETERIYNISFNITVHGKLIDPTQFEKVNAVTRISIKIVEK
jgi:hypothetical protein